MTQISIAKYGEISKPQNNQSIGLFGLIQNQKAGVTEL
jgi:hypothetical protein